MLAVFMDELVEWRERRMRRTVVYSVLVIAIVAAISILQPLLIALAATFVFLASGWADGNRYQRNRSSRRSLLSFPAAPGSIVAGKLLSALVSWGFLALLISPPFLLSAIAWGLSGKALASCYLAWLVGYLCALSVGFTSSLALLGSEGISGMALIILWIALPLFVKSAGPFNPFMQVWDIMKEEGGGSPYLGMAGTVLAAALLLAAAALTLARARRKRNA